MVTRTLMYWITRCDSLNNAVAGLITVLSVASFALSLASAFSVAVADEVRISRKTRKRLLSCAVSCVLATVLSFFLKAAIPTTREMAAIVVVPAIASAENIEKVGKAADSLFTLSNEWMQELRPKKPGDCPDDSHTEPAKAQN